MTKVCGFWYQSTMSFIWDKLVDFHSCQLKIVTRKYHRMTTHLYLPQGTDVALHMFRDKNKDPATDGFGPHRALISASSWAMIHRVLTQPGRTMMLGATFLNNPLSILKNCVQVKKTDTL